MSSAGEMVKRIKYKYGLNSPQVLRVMIETPREFFVDKKYQKFAYDDQPLPIGFGQTISQPYTVAFMTNLLIDTRKTKDKNKKLGNVLEIGTGSGYQAAILSRFFKSVFSIEVIDGLVKKARKNLKKIGTQNVKVRKGSGVEGWREKAPFDAIVITADVKEEVPKSLFDQLKVGGILVTPLRGIMTRFIKKSKTKFKIESFGRFDFVPFIDD